MSVTAGQARSSHEAISAGWRVVANTCAFAEKIASKVTCVIPALKKTPGAGWPGRKISCRPVNPHGGRTVL